MTVYDPHWIPQTKYCGLEKYFPLYQHVIPFHQLANGTRCLLQSLGPGVWEKWGVDFHGPGQNVFEVNMAYHKTDARKDVQEYFNLSPDLLDKVKEIYKMDYKILGFS
uniref:Sulfotransferase domain-containing protein n=1 Tax=Fibrocapsa japonica TaxID=94617 RepID=A0A7S2V0J9_9STRA